MAPPTIPHDIIQTFACEAAKQLDDHFGPRAVFFNRFARTGCRTEFHSDFMEYHASCRFGENWTDDPFCDLMACYITPMVQSIINYIEKDCPERLVFAEVWCPQGQIYHHQHYRNAGATLIRLDPSLLGVHVVAAPRSSRRAPTRCEVQERYEADWKSRRCERPIVATSCGGDPPLPQFYMYRFDVEWLDSDDRGRVVGQSHRVDVVARNITDAIEHGRATLHAETGLPFQITKCVEITKVRLRV